MKNDFIAISAFTPNGPSLQVIKKHTKNKQKKNKNPTKTNKTKHKAKQKITKKIKKTFLDKFQNKTRSD